MPVISHFYGINIRMFYNDHAPPQFHAVYRGDELFVGISPITIQKGHAAGRVRSMVLEWAALHQQELMDNSDRMRRGAPPDPIAPLD
jgi:Domain of unknown function (DUF4160)